MIKGLRPQSATFERGDFVSHPIVSGSTPVKLSLGTNSCVWERNKVGLGRERERLGCHTVTENLSQLHREPGSKNGLSHLFQIGPTWQGYAPVCQPSAAGCKEGERAQAK